MILGNIQERESLVRLRIQAIFQKLEIMVILQLRQIMGIVQWERGLLQRSLQYPPKKAIQNEKPLLQIHQFFKNDDSVKYRI